MLKLNYPPEQAGYAVTDGTETVSIQLDGGLSRSRKDILNSSSLVNVSWLLSPSYYEYLRAFYKETTAGGTGATPFLIDLILDEYVLTEHTAKFVPGSMTLAGMSGQSYKIQAQLEVEPIVYDDGYFLAIMALVDQFGDDAVVQAPLMFNALEKLVTVDMPGTEVFGG